MTSLTQRLAQTIRRNGPISLERFWNVALFDAKDGYYTRGTPIGTAGDFTTAPEISQMFGELVGAWLVAAWRELGRPSPFVLAEFGPGRGTMMADILRTVAKLDLAFLRAARVSLIETSDRLAAEQLQRLSLFDLPVRRVRRFQDLEALPLILVANELFDAVAIAQYRFESGLWCERLVGWEDEAFVFVPGPPRGSSELPLPAHAPQDGSIIEVSPLREALGAQIGAAIAQRTGAALIVDYGHARSGYGDTLQALRHHAFAEALREPGSRDITSHVDFERLGRALATGGAVVSPVIEQGAFLLSLGLLERAGALGRDADEAQRVALTAAVARLAGEGPDQMGALFKTLACASAPLSLPPFAMSERLD